MDNPKDSNGIVIEAGDLVASNGVVGTVKNINGWGSINVRYKNERPLYAYEEGAHDVPYEHKPYQYNRETRQYEYGETETRYKKDFRSIGRIQYDATQVRVNTSGITVLRKNDGTIPPAIAAAFSIHEIVFPAGGVSE